MLNQVQHDEKKRKNVILNDGARRPLAGSKNSIQPIHSLDLRRRYGINSTQHFEKSREKVERSQPIFI
ncbi:hypothetical protein BXT86_05885, partial [candidate division WOR-3 bacterium 4484_100]